MPLNPRYYALYISYFSGHRILHPEPLRWVIRMNNIVVITMDLKEGELLFDIMLI